MDIFEKYDKDLLADLAEDEMERDPGLDGKAASLRFSRELHKDYLRSYESDEQSIYINVDGRQGCG